MHQGYERRHLSPLWIWFQSVFDTEGKYLIVKKYHAPICQKCPVLKNCTENELKRKSQTCYPCTSGWKSPQTFKMNFFCSNMETPANMNFFNSCCPDKLNHNPELLIWEQDSGLLRILSIMQTKCKHYGTGKETLDGITLFGCQDALFPLVPWPSICDNLDLGVFWDCLHNISTSSRLWLKVNFVITMFPFWGWSIMIPLALAHVFIGWHGRSWRWLWGQEWSWGKTLWGYRHVLWFHILIIQQESVVHLGPSMTHPTIGKNWTNFKCDSNPGDIQWLYITLPIAMQVLPHCYYQWLVR